MKRKTIVYSLMCLGMLLMVIDWIKSSEILGWIGHFSLLASSILLVNTDWTKNKNTTKK